MVPDGLDPHTFDSFHFHGDPPMRKAFSVAVLAAALALGAPERAAAQTAPTGLLEVGAVAPDFALPGATRYGLLEEPVRLSDYEGKTVVLAFFFRVRTRG
jgi:hypothetical protein